MTDSHLMCLYRFPFYAVLARLLTAIPARQRHFREFCVVLALSLVVGLQILALHLFDFYPAIAS